METDFQGKLYSVRKYLIFLLDFILEYLCMKFFK